MRNFIRRFLLAVLLLPLFFSGSAQEAPMQEHPHHRCGTMEALQKIITKNPSIVNKWKANGERAYNNWLQRKLNQPSQREGTLEQDGATVIIPVVFHLIGSASLLNQIPDRDVYDQLEQLNRDYSGRKMNSYLGQFAPELAARVGNISVKFVLARTDTNGNHTSGIERRATNASFTGDDLPSLKSTAADGLNAWDPERYLNVWCATFTDGLLGIATFPYVQASDGLGPHGVCIDLYTLGNNACRPYNPLYNEGATLSHEIGHFFYLYHTFGDNSACNNDDFRTESGWPLPATIIDDTPEERAISSVMYGNLSGIYSDGCTTSPFGMMYMNYMNYYDDRSLFMFSAGQKERVMATLDMYRDQLKMSTTNEPPSAVTDAWLVNLAPHGTCDGIAPIVNNAPLSATVRNYGTTTLTSITLRVQIDAQAPVSTTFSINLAAGKDTTLKLGNISGSTGAHTVTVYTMSPNGGTDRYLHNDTAETHVNIRTNTLTAPFTESFTSTNFPPQQSNANDLWLINNPQSTTWSRSATAGYAATGSATLPNYSYNGWGQFDELITPPIDFGIHDSATLIFKVAHAQGGTRTDSWDGLEIYVSNDGGVHYALAYKKVSDKLKTVPGSLTSSFNPGTNQAQWRSDTVNLTKFLNGSEKMIIKFRNVNASGNNLYLDDINLTAFFQPSRDIIAVSLANIPAQVCGTPIGPKLTIKSNGKEPVTSVKINYRLDNGTASTSTKTVSLSQGQSTTIDLDSLRNIPVGTHTLTVYTSDPNNLSDLFPANDTLRATFVAQGSQSGPLSEGFEGAFPPTNWVLNSSGGAYTWQKNSTAGFNSNASAWIKNYRYNSNGKKDDLVTVAAHTGAHDSAYLHFDLAHTVSVYPGTTTIPLDTLEVLITTDCGKTYTSVYKKWGAALMTYGDVNVGVQYNRLTDTVGFVPTQPSQWRKEKIDVSQWVKANTTYQVVFRNSANGDNNTFIDNVNLEEVLIPEKLRTNGYMIAPNPFSGWFEVRHLTPPANLTGLVVFSASGQLVYSQHYNGNAGTYQRVDLGRYASGMYIVRLIYDNKVITERIIKAR